MPTPNYASRASRSLNQQANQIFALCAERNDLESYVAQQICASVVLCKTVRCAHSANVTYAHSKINILQAQILTFYLSCYPIAPSASQTIGHSGDSILHFLPQVQQIGII